MTEETVLGFQARYEAHKRKLLAPLESRLERSNRALRLAPRARRNHVDWAAAVTPEALRAARARLGLSQAQLAKRLQLPGGSRTVRRWELGERSIPGPVAVALALMLRLLAGALR